MGISYTEVEKHKLIIEQPKLNYRTGSESARNRDPEEYESTVFYSTFVLQSRSTIVATPVTPINEIVKVWNFRVYIITGIHSSE